VKAWEFPYAGKPARPDRATQNEALTEKLPLEKPEASPEARLKAKPVKLMLTVTIQHPLTEGEMEQLRQNGGDLTGLLYDGLEVKIEKVTGRHAG
jgi:hypothetical protein